MDEILMGGNLISLHRNIYKIGRHFRCHIRLTDLTVSRFACALTRNDEGQWILTDGDLDSGALNANGVKLNGIPINPEHGEILQHGDEIELSSSTKFKFFSKEKTVEHDPESTQV